ncbi:hypothetical protein SKAU_G00013340 [Synaphobranchus kaupii]|uniref:Uncharacterized protein n=1 Tax=Synaphobranchus kaupii TaxID=118154 RepID=A0A9Q1GBL9_SYNKA|nr:hypothetical protein SKAU_G00013340 [Synaphobranchus kaupii]
MRRRGIRHCADTGCGGEAAGGLSELPHISLPTAVGGVSLPPARRVADSGQDSQVARRDDQGAVCSPVKSPWRSLPPSQGARHYDSPRGYVSSQTKAESLGRLRSSWVSRRRPAFGLRNPSDSRAGARARREAGEPEHHTGTRPVDYQRRVEETEKATLRVRRRAPNFQELPGTRAGPQNCGGNSGRAAGPWTSRCGRHLVPCDGDVTWRSLLPPPPPPPQLSSARNRKDQMALSPVVTRRARLAPFRRNQTLSYISRVCRHNISKGGASSVLQIKLTRAKRGLEHAYAERFD